MTQHQILHRPNGLPWWHKPSLWQQWRHKTMAKRFWPPIPLCATVSTLSHDSASNSPQTQWIAMVAQAVAMATMTSQNHGQAILTPYSPLCHRFNTVTWLSIKFPTNPAGCHGGTSRRYGNMDVMFCPKTMAKRFWPPIPLCATISTLSHDSASNSPQTQRVAMVAQAVAMATWTSCFVQKPWPSDFDPLFPFVPPFQHCHMTQHRIPHKPSGLPWWHKPSLWQQWRHKTMAKRFWPPIPLCATVSTLSHDSASNSPQTQWVAMVAQAVAMATMTSCFVQKPWPNVFDPLFPFVPPFQHCHMTQHRIPHRPSG